MTKYRATISADKYPMDFTVEATDWPTAMARATRLWKKRFKGSRTTILKVTMVKVVNHEVEAEE